MDTSIIIVGTGGHAVSVTNVALSCGIDVIAYVDENKAQNEIMGTPIITKQQCLNYYPNLNFAIAIGDNSIREKVYNEYKNDFPTAKFPTLIHKSSVIGIGSSIGDGTIIMPLVNVGPNSNIGRFCILNSSSSIDHDCTMREFSSIAPRVVCGGAVEIGELSAVSIGATVKHGVMIGVSAVIGANSYVHRSIGDNVVAYGSPCKTIRTREKDDTYLD